MQKKGRTFESSSKKSAEDRYDNLSDLYQYIDDSGSASPTRKAGGQNANRNKTTAIICLNVRHLEPAVRKQLREQKHVQITQNGTIIIRSSEHKSREQNRRAGLKRLDQAISLAKQKPKKRIATQRTKGSEKRRKRSQERHSQKKKDRQMRSVFF